MRRLFALTLLLSLVGSAEARGQALDDALVPRGRVRFELNPVFTTWESRFGRSSTGEDRREALGQDLTASSAELLFPGAASLRSAIASLSGAASYTPVMGETLGRVSKDITRVELGAQVGIFDWLSVGALLPWTRTRTSVDVIFQADTLTGDLGVNPGSGATAFRQALASAASAAAGQASQVCASSPGSPGCASATALSARTSAFGASAEAAYGASAFFPLAGSATATSLAQATAALHADLVAAGLPGIPVPMAFATDRVDELDLLTLPQSSASRVVGAPLGDVKGLWHAGDVELSVTARVAERSAGTESGALSYTVLATLLARLPTGLIDAPDFFLDVGTGDGQLDVEARLAGTLGVGDRFGVRGGARYGVQRSRTLVRRVAAPEEVLAPLDTRQLVEWDPGAYWGVELAPVLRLSEALALGGEYRAFRKYRDRYTLTGASVGAPVATSLLEVESGVTLHEIGVALRYDTVARWLLDGTTRPMQFQGRVLRAVAGGGGQTPVTTRVEFGVRLFRRIWGAP